VRKGLKHLIILILLYIPPIVVMKLWWNRPPYDYIAKGIAILFVGGIVSIFVYGILVIIVEILFWAIKTFINLLPED